MLQQIVATFIGALAAFVFSLALFYLTERWKNQKINSDLCRNLQKELEYNIAFLELYKKDLRYAGSNHHEQQRYLYHLSI